MQKSTIPVNGRAMPKSARRAQPDSISLTTERRSFIGGSDARIIMGNDETKLIRLWREKRGEIAPENLGEDLLVQLGTITEELNRMWYERCTGSVVEDVQRRVWLASDSQMDGCHAGRPSAANRCRV